MFSRLAGTSVLYQRLFIDQSGTEEKQNVSDDPKAKQKPFATKLRFSE
jgi:hypothetical protein